MWSSNVPGNLERERSLERPLPEGMWSSRNTAFAAVNALVGEKGKCPVIESAF